MFSGIHGRFHGEGVLGVRTPFFICLAGTEIKIKPEKHLYMNSNVNAQHIND